MYVCILTPFPYLSEASVTEVRVRPPVEYTYTPNYCQYFFAHLDVNYDRNVGIIAQVIFNELHDHTVLRITWEGVSGRQAALAAAPSGGLTAPRT